MRSRPVLLFAAISLALHLAWMVWMPAGETAARPEEQWVEVSFEREEAKAPPSPAAAVTEAPVGREPAVRKSSRSSSPSTTLKPAAAANSSSEVAQPSAAEPTAMPEKPAKVPVLSPRLAALSVDALARVPGLRCAAPAAGESGIGPADCAPDDHGEVAQAALQRDLNTIAKTIPHLKTREAPDLKRRSDGSFAYDGHVFQALVRPDGQVDFTDTSEQAQFMLPLTIRAVADVNDLVEKQVLGRELYSAEKAWFLEQTRELRAQLSADARRRELQQANRALERTLQDVLGDSALSIAQKHDAVFLIWQDCGEDVQQKAHRHSVEAFIRRYMPHNSALGFRVDELERFNARRGALQKFEPYSES